MSAQQQPGQNPAQDTGDKRRRTSQFTPPPVFFEEPERSAETLVPASSSPKATRAGGKVSIVHVKAEKRRFSHDELVVPIAPNTSAADLEFVDTLIRGTFAELVLVRRKDTNQIVVAKAFHHGTWRAEYLCQSELRVFQTVNSPWLIAFYGFIQDYDENFLLLEYQSHGNLYQMMKHRGRLSESQTRFYSAEMFLAVDSLHQRGFMHRNIQLANYLMHSSGHLRLCDLGLSYKFDTEEDHAPDTKPSQKLITNPVFASADKSVPTNRNLEGGFDPEGSSIDGSSIKEEKRKVVSECSTYYLAPEVLRLLLPKPYFRLLRRKVGYSYLCDYWSLGVALYHMMYCQLPFVPDNQGCILDKVLDYRKTLTFPIHDTKFVPVDGVTLVKALLKKEVKRIGYNEGIVEIQRHVFYRSLQWDRLGHGHVAIPIRNSEFAGYCVSEDHSSDVSHRKVSKSTSQKDDSTDDEEEQLIRAVNAQNLGALDTFKVGVPLLSDPSVKCKGRRSHESLHSQGGAASSKSADGSSRVHPVAAESRRLIPLNMEKMPSTSKGTSSPPAGSLAAERRLSHNTIDRQQKESERSYMSKLLGWFSNKTDGAEQTPSATMLVSASELPPRDAG